MVPLSIRRHLYMAPRPSDKFFLVGGQISFISSPRGMGPYVIPIIADWSRAWLLTISMNICDLTLTLTYLPNSSNVFRLIIP